MNEFIRKVTITGIDLYTNRMRLNLIQKVHPFVEWGVLLSTSKAGKENRFPPTEWIDELSGLELNLSGHVCGTWARDITEGGRQFVDAYQNRLQIFQRLQLNISHVLESIHSHDDFYRGLEQIVGPRVIVQVRGDSLWAPVIAQILNKTDVLFDCSGGRGILPDNWPSFPPVGNYGYAGGLNPDNLEEQIRAMSEASGGQSVWIDVESGVRTNEVLDLDKVERFLDIAAPHVLNGTDNANDLAAV